LNTEGETPKPATSQSKRRRGRPKGNFDAAIDWDSIEKAYVYGDEVSKKDFEGSGKTVPARHFPSVRELAAKRELYRKTFEQELTLAIAKARALSTADAVAILDGYIRQFSDAINEGRVRSDAIADLNTAMRLKQFMQGEADSRSAVSHTVSLDALQAAHKARGAEVLPSDAIAGVLPGDDGGAVERVAPIEAEGVEVDPFEGASPAAEEASPAE
jgi:hypothetical protein